MWCGKKGGQPFGLHRVFHKVRVAGGGHHVGHGLLREVPGGGHCHTGALHRVLWQRQGRAGELTLQCVVGSQHLSRYAVQPRFVLLLGGAQVAFRDDLHALCACREGQARQAQVALQPGQPVRYQGERPGECLRVFQDECGVHQREAVVAHQRGGLDHGIDLPEVLGVAEHRERLVLEMQPQQLQRDRDAANVG